MYKYSKTLLRKVFPYSLFFLIALYLIKVFYSDLSPNEFLFVGDQYLRFSLSETLLYSLHLRKLSYLGSHNGWQMIVQLLDSLFYVVVYLFDFTILQAEKINMFITLFITMTFSYMGFSRISKILAINTNKLILFVITLWFSFNPYTMELWHGGVLNIGSALTYSLAPIILSFIHELTLKKLYIKQILLLSFLLFLSSFTFWLFAPVLFMLVIYFVTRLFSKDIQWDATFSNGVKVVFAYIPLIMFIFFAITHVYFTNIGDDSHDFVGVYSNQQGGLWYQILMYFSWGIYTVWTPRSLYSFGDYFFSNPYIISTLSIYIFVILGAVLLWKSRLHVKPLFTFGLLLLLSLFFAKGAQEPFGFIFEYLYYNVPFFNIFRTPDIRFGYVIITSLACLMLLISEKFNKYLFSLLLVTIMFLQTAPFFSGIAVRGEDIEGKYYDRIVHIPEEYFEMAKFLNSEEKPYYVLALPGINYGMYDLGAGDIHIGQDILGKLTTKPFIHMVPFEGTSKEAYSKIENIVIGNSESKEFLEFPIKYAIFRKNVICIDCEELHKFLSNFEIVLDNDIFTLYALPHSPLVNGGIARWDFVSPVRFEVDFLNSMPGSTQVLNLLLSYNDLWRLYLLPQEDSSQFNEKKIFDNTHDHLYGYANTWKLSTDYILQNFDNVYYTQNPDGGVNFSVAIYYVPQLYFNLLVKGAFLVGIGYIGILLLNHFKRNKL